MGQNQVIVRGSMPTPIGELLVFSIEERIVAIEFQDRGHAEARIRRFLPGARFVDGAIPIDAHQALQLYFDMGKADAFDDLAIEPFGSPFQLQVWEELRRIPGGTVTSYGAIAKAIGRPGACRAVGAANGQNPIPIVIPCHRVVGSDRSLTGYGSGLDRKAWLLRNEGASFTGCDPRRQGEFPLGE